MDNTFRPTEYEHPYHLGEVKGWLEDSDPFFGIIDFIVADRRKGMPLSSADPK